MLLNLFRITKQYIHHFNKNNYLHALNQHTYLLDTFNVLKSQVSKINIKNKYSSSFEHLYLKELESIKNELNSIKNDIEMCNKNYTLQSVTFQNVLTCQKLFLLF